MYKRQINGYVEEIKNEEGKASAYPEIQVIQKKASTDENVNINMDFFGLDLSKVPNQNMGDITVYIIPCLLYTSSNTSFLFNHLFPLLLSFFNFATFIL